MEIEPQKRVRIGDWIADPGNGTISRNGESTRLEVRAMRLLLALAARPGEIVSSDELLAEVWSGVTVSQDSVYQAIASLRRQLGDDSKQPAYIVTVPRLGYRLIASVGPVVAGSPHVEPARQHRRDALIAGFAAMLIVTLAWVVFYPRLHRALHPATPAAIAILPFQDLTEGMQEAEFADGMTEELIDKFSRIPGLRVTAPSAVFYYKNKQVALPEVARSLRVGYIVDGSIRKSGNRVRIAARLVRAQTGYVLWSETYDRPFHDLIAIQDEIADKVVHSLEDAHL